MFFQGEIPFIRILLAYCSGILLAIFLPNEETYHWSIPLILGLLGVSYFIVLFYASLSFFKIAWLPGLLVNCLLCLGAYYHTIRTSQKLDSFHFSRFTNPFLVVQVTEEPLLRNKIQKFKAEVLLGTTPQNMQSLRGNILISNYADSSFINLVEYGDVLLIPGKFAPTEPSYNPGEFDYSSWLAYKQVYHQAFVPSTEFRIIGRKQGKKVLLFAINLRKKLVDTYSSYISDKQSASLASALILGYRSELSSELVQTYSRTGTIHVLSVSGMHVALIFVVISRLLSFMDSKFHLRVMRALLIVAIIWSYAMLTGFSAPANRAACMISFIVIGKAIKRSQNRYNLLAIAAFLLLLYNPFYLTDMGFQLSFVAVLGLFYFQKPIADLLELQSKWFSLVWNYISLSLAAQLATFPIAMYYFHQFPVYFLLSNLFIVIPVSMIMYAGILFLIVPIHSVQSLFGVILSELIWFTNAGLKQIENLPLSSISGLWLEGYELLIIGMIFLFLILRTFNFRLAFGAALGLSLLLCSCFSLKKISSYFRSDLLLYSFNRNSGLAFSLKGESVLISDFPKKHSTFDYSIIPGIQSRGYSSHTFLNYDQFSNGAAYYCRPGFMQFRGFKLLRWTPDFDNRKFLNVLAVDALLLAANARTPLHEISKNVDFGQLFIEASNNNYTIDRYRKEAQSLNISVYVLKKNPAKVIKL